MKESEAKVIDFETHMQSTEFIKEVSKYDGYPRYRYDSRGKLVIEVNPHLSEQREAVRKVSEDPKVRIEAMDKTGTDVQVISSSNPGCEVFPKELGIRLGKTFNDQLAAWIGRYPDRFVGYCSLPVQDVQSALTELDRAAGMGFKGIMLFSNVGGEYADSTNLWPIYERAEQLGFPIFLHPGYPLNMNSLLLGGLWGPPFGFGVDCATSSLRMIMSGVFERFPKLRAILGHLGETIPYTLGRVDISYNKEPEILPQLKKKPSEYFLENFYVDTSGVGSEPSLMCAYESLHHERIIFASDYPFGSVERELELVRNSRIPELEQRKIFGQNGAKLLGI